ncbi:PilW family protein [Photobacterium iliopiscarium]|uniref:PilW family protein n=1 Tax=Photobacterium iliopiscarium TaxID=56192 RepID=UPI000D1626B3|nr:prepilin-type N-terminal cleavage/methylation domain-containing protein [Photobacterium iliopiscarium]PST95341.1 pilus assembly protein PilW [Photobacterium iliopiscarium]PST96442.1 pilus assembly protein PilW [Photobacterium iliopiscarium]PSV78818.1 pilus assembly protein PilW [Photobacterium iliopiscarium]
MRSANQGFSLIELLIASSVGLIAIGIVGSVFLSGYQAANKRSLELLLQQDVNDAFRLIKEDVLRAGYVSSGGNTLRLLLPNGVSKADNVVYVNTTEDCLAYTYQNEDGLQIYNSAFLKEINVDGKKINVLKYNSASAAISTDEICEISGASSLLYEKQIAVSKFKIEHKEISSASATSQLIKITLAAHLKNDDSVSTAKSIQIKTRNWQ